MICPEAMPDGTRDGDGTWFAGKWYPMQFQSRARALMVPDETGKYSTDARPRGPAVRAEAHAEFLETADDSTETKP